VAQQAPDTVVATIAGKQITARQAADLLKELGPEERKRYESNLAGVLQQIYMRTQLADEAAAMKLDQQSPWKEQLESTRKTILAQAYVKKTAENQGALPNSRAYYDTHPDDFDQVKLSGILIAFNQPGTPASASAVQRTEAQAQEKANDLEKKLKAGGDFAALARTESDNQQSAVRGGELGTFMMADQGLPPEVKAVISKMQTGQISEPVRVPGGFYIFRIDNRSKLPYEQVQAAIVQRLQNERMQEILKKEADKYKVEVKDPDFFAAPGSATPPSLRVPSLQRPGSPPLPGPNATPSSKPPSSAPPQ
jgi:hypothetical protein